jgi:hypothetical protein
VELECMADFSYVLDTVFTRTDQDLTA